MCFFVLCFRGEGGGHVRRAPGTATLASSRESALILSRRGAKKKNVERRFQSVDYHMQHCDRVT